MGKKIALAVFGLILAMTLTAPQKAQAAVHIGVAIGAPVAYGGIEVAPAPYAYYGAPAYYDAPAYDQPYVERDYYPAYPGYYDRGGCHRGERWEHRRWREHEWREHEWREHHRHWGDDDDD
jgi:hypothetical protein